MEAYRRYGPALLRKGQRLLGNRSDAEDVVQGLFADLVSRGEGTMDLPYLYRALTNRCLNLVRDARNHERLLAQHDVVLRGEVRTRCDDQVIGVDLLVKLALRLDPKATEVLVYRYFDDLTQDEIAELLATSRKTVGKRLDQVRAAVRALTEKETA